MNCFLMCLLTLFSVTAEVQAAAAKNRPPVPVKAVISEQELNPVTINTVLFSEGTQSWTTRDFNLYKKLVRHLTKQDKLTVLADTIEYDFLVTRLLKREALLFEIKPKKYDFPLNAHPDLAEYSKTEINDEIEIIELAAALLEFKEKQMSQKARFKAWVDVLKR